MLKLKLWYLKDSNGAAHSVDTVTYVTYIVINLSAHSVLHYNLYLLKQCQIVVCNIKSILVNINFMHHEASMARDGRGVTRDRDNKAHTHTIHKMKDERWRIFFILFDRCLNVMSSFRRKCLA